jgi:hypothetical protein
MQQSFFISEGMKAAEIRQQLATKCRKNCLHSEVCMNGSKCLEPTELVLSCCRCREIRTSVQTNEQNMEHAKAVIFANSTKTTMGTAKRLGINVALLWCKLLV